MLLNVLYPLLGRALLAVAGVSLALGLPAAGQAQSAGTDQIEKRLSELEAGQRKILETLNRLESRMNASEEGTPGASPVTVRVRSASGKPLAGYEAHLALEVNQGRTIQARGTSDDQGLALDRRMPYGRYRLSLSQDGWTARIPNIVVEVGGSHALEIVAPDPDEQGTIVLQTDLDDKALRGLPFGEITSSVGQGRAYTVQVTPEPGDDEGASYPQVDQGIEQVGVRFGVEVTQTLDQPERDPLEWQWNLRVDRKGYLILTPWGIQVLREIDYKRRRPEGEREFYNSLGRTQEVGFLIVSKTEMLNTPYPLKVPAGDVEVKLTDLYGLATEEVASMLTDELTDDQSVWLSTNLRAGTAWGSRLFELEGWRWAETGFTLSKNRASKARRKSHGRGGLAVVSPATS